MSDDGEKRKRSRLALREERHARLRTRGIVFVDKEIDEDYVSAINHDLLYMHSCLDFAEKPIWIVLNSPGGDLYHGLALHDVLVSLREFGTKINILGIGSVASAAGVILQAGTRRYSLPNTQFLVHQLSELKIFSDEEVNEVKENAKELDRINKVVMNIIAKRTGRPLVKLLKDTEKKNLCLGAEAAKAFGEHGLIDEITVKIPF